ncbi:MAG: hypothetical protein M1814_003703 [Vezdaea aestivalis]|nr:MAG: hypothetical protein M1814_003703 [Vezdaea aestivalis]
MDFERENAKEWFMPVPEDPPVRLNGLSVPSRCQDTNNSFRGRGRGRVGRSVQKRPRGLLDRLPLNRDKPAKTRWRKGLICNANFKIGDRDRGNLSSELKMINEVTGVWIPMPNAREKRLCIWGDPPQVAEAQQLLEDWSKSDSRSAQDHFHQAIQSDLRGPKDVAIEEQYIGQCFLTQAPSSADYTHTGYFKWASDFDPFEVFGRNLEALDPIRMEEWVYIRYHSIEQTFEFLSEFHISIANSLDRMLVLLRELCCRAQVTHSHHIFEVVPHRELKSIVKLCGPLGSLETEDRGSKFLVLAGADIQTTEQVRLGRWNKDVFRDDLNSFAFSFTQVMEGMKVYRGTVRLGINFGTFHTHRYRKSVTGQYGLEEFHEMTKDPGFLGALDKNLASITSADQIFERVANTHGAFYYHDERPEVQYEAKIQLEIPNLGLVCLELSFLRSGDNLLAVSNPLWLNLFQDYAQPGASSRTRLPLEANFLRLHSRLDWNIELSAMSILDASQITPQMKRFIKGAKVVESLIGPKLTLPVVPNLKFHSATLVEFWTFDIKNSSYSVRLSKTHSISLPSVAKRPIMVISVPSAQASPPVVELSAFRRAWADALDSQSMLGTGKVSAVDWSPRIEDIFPSEDAKDTSIDSGIKNLFDMAHGMCTFLENDQP